jgi:O-antigen/teichoic acid export membrane protein
VLLVLFSERLAADVFRIAADSQARAAQALRIAAGTIFLSLLSQVFAAILQGLHRFDIHSKLVNLGNIALLGGNLFLALSGYGLTELFYWNLAVTGFNCLFFFLTARRLLPEVKIFQRFRPEALKLVIGYSASIVAYQILANLLVLFERAWVTRQFGTENLTFYVVSMTVSFQLHYFIASLVLVIFPLASELQNDRERLQRLYTKATKIIVSLVVIIGLTLIVQSRLFLSLWLGENFAAAAAHLLAIHTVSMSLVAGATVSWQMTEGLGYPNFNLLLIVLSWIFTVPLVIYLSESYGTTGVAVGRLIGFSVMFASIFYVEKWFFRKVLSGFWLALIGRLILAATAAALVETFVNKYFSVAWTTFLFSCAAGSLSFAAVLWMTGFVAEDERQLLRRVLGLRAAEN